MHKNKKISALFLSLILPLGFSPLISQAAPVVQGPLLPEPAPTFEVDAKGQKMHIDFNLAPKPISNPNLKFSQFAKQKVMLFYFSASCPHCQHAAPYVEKLAHDISGNKITTIAIAIKNNSEEEIKDFISTYKLDMPVFYDETKEIGEKYGTGSIPLIFMINEKGEYIRHKSFDANETPVLVKAEAAQFTAK